MKIPGKTIVKKRTWFIVYLCVLSSIYIPYLYFYIKDDDIKNNIIEHILTILIYFVLGLIPLINDMNLLTNTYKCASIKETNITQTFSCEDIHPNKYNTDILT